MFFNEASDNQLKYILPILKKLIDDIDPKNYVNERDNLDSFMSNFYFRKDDLNVYIYNIIANKNNDILDLNILYYFECKCELYFKKIIGEKKLTNLQNKDELVQHSNDVIKNLSLKYFKKALDYYLDEKPLNQLETQINKIGKLYSLAFIKIYLKQISRFIVYNMNKNIINCNDIFNIFLFKNQNKYIYALKIYLFKCIFKNLKFIY